MAQKNGADNTQPPNAEKPSLEKRISAFEDRQTERQSRATKAQMPVEGMAMAGRVAAELVAGLAVGGGVGWALDKVFGTSPLWLVVLFFLGAIGGMMNVWRIATGRGMAAGYFDEHDGTPSEQKNKSSEIRRE